MKLVLLEATDTFLVLLTKNSIMLESEYQLGYHFCHDVVALS